MNIFKIEEVSELLDDPIKILMLLMISTILGFLISWTYYRTYGGFSYSQSFSNTLIIMTVITTLIIMIIGDNIARAVGIFGAFSIIRFRTAVKDTRDTAFLFLALATGLAIGTISVEIGVIGVIFIVFLIFILHTINFGGNKKTDHVLNFHVDIKKYKKNLFKEVIKRFTKTQNILNMENKNNNSTLVFTLAISFKKKKNSEELIEKLSNVDGVSDINIVNSKSDLEF